MIEGRRERLLDLAGSRPDRRDARRWLPHELARPVKGLRREPIGLAAVRTNQALEQSSPVWRADFQWPRLCNLSELPTRPRRMIEYPLNAMEVFSRAPGTEASQVGDDFVVLDAEGRVVRGLNRAGARIWELIDGRRSLAEIADCLAAEFGIPAAQALQDLTSFVAQLVDRKLLVPTGDRR